MLTETGRQFAQMKLDGSAGLLTKPSFQAPGRLDLGLPSSDDHNFAVHQGNLVGTSARLSLNN
jgi:hypothetical protein